jgi:hypothetical protein
VKIQICDDNGKILGTVIFSDKNIKRLKEVEDYNAAGIAQDILGELVYPLTDCAERIIE